MPLYLPAMICLFSSSPFGPPAISTNVGTQSNEENISLKMVPGLTTPGQRMTHGAHATLPGRQLPGFEWGDAAVREGLNLGTVVGGEDDDGIVELAHVFELLEDEADVVVHLLHAGFVDTPILAALFAHHVQIFLR